MAYTKEWLQSQINSNAETVEQQQDGEAYYRMMNTKINDRVKAFYTTIDDSMQKVVDPYKANWKLASGFLKLLVEQKVNYSINTGMQCDISGRSAEDVFGDGWVKTLQRVGRDASVKKYGVMQFYLDSSGSVKWKVVKPEQCVLCYDQDENLTHVIRVYSKRDENGKVVNVAEVWDSETMTRWEQSTSEDWKCSQVVPHLMSQSTVAGNVVEEKPLSWGRPPFAVFRNNQYLDSDLNGVRAYIDAYDFTNSDFCNNLEDFQDMMWVIKNYDGTDLSEFFRDVKAYKAIKVSDDGEAKQESQEIPHEAKTIFLDRLKYDIFMFGMGVNTDDLEGNITNVRIKAMYNNLDLKATSYEQECTSFIEQWAYFLTGGNEVDVSVTYDRSLIMNNLEMSKLANESVGSISEETRLSHDPRVTDVVEEMERLKKENIVDPVASPEVEDVEE